MMIDKRTQLVFACLADAVKKEFEPTTHHVHVMTNTLTITVADLLNDCSWKIQLEAE